MTNEQAVLEERQRCVNIVLGWYQFEAKEGGTRFCVACNQANEVAKAILNPEYAEVVEKLRMEYATKCRLEVDIR